MNKKIYNAPEITVVEMASASIMAGSNGLVENADGGDDLSATINVGTIEEADGGTARVGSNQYFDAWEDE